MNGWATSDLTDKNQLAAEETKDESSSTGREVFLARSVVEAIIEIEEKQGSHADKDNG